MSQLPFLLGYNTNGFAHHRLDDALRIIAELGYRAVALTPDANHLPPDSTPAELRATRVLLDARRKHFPTLIDANAADRARRSAFLVRCAQIATELGGDTISLWSGIPAPAVARDDAWRWLVDGVGALCHQLAPLGIQVAFEPEPGMLLQTLGEWDQLRDAVAAPNFGLALDVGHVPCTESFSAGDAIRRYGAAIRTVHLDDTRNGVHEHLQIGDGELDWADIMRALREVGFRGIAAVELSRHSHAAPMAARTAREQLRAAGA
jgi:sugar phosphate isomerase/epimerase